MDSYVYVEFEVLGSDYREYYLLGYNAVLIFNRLYGIVG
jgi:hypothetical protein